MNIATVGIDVSKSHLDLVIDRVGTKPLHRQFAYTEAGQVKILKWLASHDAVGSHVCLEATGRYSLPIAIRLYDAGYTVSVENPLRTKKFAESILLRQKTDKVDALALARYARLMTPGEWMPPTQLQSELQELKRLRDDLQDDRTRVINRLEGLRGASPARRHLYKQRKQIEKQIAEVEQDINDLVDDNDTLSRKSALLTSIPGIGRTTARELLAEIPDWSLYDCANALVAYAGLCPRHFQSGKKKGHTRLSKQGNSHIRKTLYYPALSAMQHNPHLKRFAERLKAAGKEKMVVVAAVMRKLLVLAYAIIKSGTPYDHNYQNVA